MALLGSVMLRPEALHDIADIVSLDSFYSDKHRIIYDTMMELFTKHDPIDLLSVSAKLKEKGWLDQIGGNTYLTELVNVVPSSANIVYYAQIVQKKHIMRRLIEASDHINQLGYDETGELEEMLDNAEKKLFEVTNFNTSHKFVPLKDELAEAWDRLDRLHSEGSDGMRGVPTGFAALDNKLSGLQKSDLIILAARPSMGKTSLALDIARQSAVNHGTPVGIFSLEMSSQQLVDRMLSAQSNVDAWKMRTGKLSRQDDFDAIRTGLDKLSKAPIFIDDQPGNNILKMRSIARRLKSEHGLGLIIVDYLQLMVPVGASARGTDNLVQQTTEISHSLKNLARELEVPVLALSQLSRAVEQRGGRPRLSDLRDSGCLTGDTLITRADTGERVQIQSLVGQTDVPIFSLDAHYKLITLPTTKVFSSGVKEVFEIKTRSGRTIKASANHKFFTLSGWNRLDEFKPEMRIAIPRALSVSTQENTMMDSEVILLAHLLGDGCVLPRQPIHYTSADPKNIEMVKVSVKMAFGITPRVVKQENWWHVYLPSPYHLTHGKHHPIIHWFTKLGISPVRSYEKKIPDAIFKTSEKQIKLFLHHLWATDGNISWKKLPGRKPVAAIYYASTSLELAQGVQHLLLRLGIWSTLKKVLQGKYRPIYQIHIQSAPVQLKFCELVGSFGARGDVVPEIMQTLREVAPNTNTDTVPREIWQMFVGPEKEKMDMSWRDVSSKMEISYNGSALMATGVSRMRLVKLATILSSEKLLHLAESDVYWDEVVSVTSLGEQEVFDATVPGTHNFVADDFIVHNSIEQDADIVLMIHREDKYKDEADRTNIAEIMIEKHRNGETGKVELFFNDKKATFQNMDKSEYGGAEKEFSDF